MEGFPRINNKLIVLSNNTKSATIGSNFFRQKEWPIILGYKSAGDKLAKYINGLDSITEVYPTIFLYRQFIELYIKYIYKYYIANDIDEYNTFIKEVQHDLIKSFDKICLVINQDFFGENDNNIINATKQYIHELSKLDPDSFNFRYATNKKGNVIHPKELNIDLLKMKEGINELANFFSRVEECIIYMREYEKETESSYY